MAEGWEISVLIDDLQVTRRLRIRGDTHIGGVMLRLVESIDVKMDWSDHGLWWPEQNRWLLKTSHTLDRAGVQTGDRLEFRRMHARILLQLPDLQERELFVSFAQSVFSLVVWVCKSLSIRHPEELSLRRPPRPAELTSLSSEFNSSGGTLRFGSFRRSKAAAGSAAATNGNGTGYYGNRSSATSSLQSSPHSPVSVMSLALDTAELACLANSPHVSAHVAFTERGLLRQRCLADRAAANEAWLDSARSLMEQGVRPDQRLQLRFKFLAFYDLSAKYDAVRINQIYEQARWSLLAGEIEASMEESLLLAALQLQVNLAAADEVSHRLDDFDGVDGGRGDDRRGNVAGDDDDDIDAALADLEATLMGDGALSPTLGSPKITEQQQQGQQHQHLQHSPTSSSPPGLSSEPELVAHLSFLQPGSSGGGGLFSLRRYQRRYFVLRGGSLLVYRDRARTHQVDAFHLAGSELTTDVNAGAGKFGIRLLVPDPGSRQLQELSLRCDTREQFAEWTAGLALAADGKTLASRSIFDAEVQATMAQLSLQAPARSLPRRSLSSSAGARDIDPADFVAARHLKSSRGGGSSGRSSAIVQGILERHANIVDKTSLEAKLDYIRVWQRLPGFGVAHFLVQSIGEDDAADGNASTAIMTLGEFRKDRSRRHHGAKDRQLIGVAHNRLMWLDADSGQATAAWRLEELQSWTLNWELYSLQLVLSRLPYRMVLVPIPCGAATAASTAASSTESNSADSSNNKRSLCKNLAEFIGGHVFLSLRRPDKNQQLNEQLYHKLTGSKDPNA